MSVILFVFLSGFCDAKPFTVFVDDGDPLVIKLNGLSFIISEANSGRADFGSSFLFDVAGDVFNGFVRVKKVIK